MVKPGGTLVRGTQMKQIRRGAHRSVSELERAIYEFLDTHNVDPKPLCVDQERRGNPGQHIRATIITDE